MRTATDLLTQYAAYHRDRRNIATHAVGVPLIVFAVGVLLARPVLAAPGGWAITPALLAWLASAVWYLRRDAGLGAATALAVGLLVAAGHAVTAGMSLGGWLTVGLGSFVVGWAIQFVGHHWEGRKPAFVDDLVGLLVGPMFVVAEGLFALGWNRGLQARIEAEVGPTHGGAPRTA